ncbi:hypothetical protein [Sphingomicrobium arenosum]|uniref:hypothetical protein n=1 Tax=Sphingomicrobium arenosum TaxID=2233861 RepID=UPI00223EC1F7|nr:hypothetical protein [Sphingomicrobium arenosum]
MNEAFDGPLLQWGNGAILCEGHVRVSGDGPELAALGTLPTGPVWISDYSHDATRMHLAIASHEGPDAYGFVHQLKRLFSLSLPRQLGGLRDLPLLIGSPSKRLEYDVAKGREDELHLMTSVDMPAHLGAWGDRFRCKLAGAPGGTRLLLDATLHPRKGGPQPLPEEIRVEVDILIPPPYGQHQTRYDSEARFDDPQALDWRARRFASAGPGHVDWGQGEGRGPFVAFHENNDPPSSEPRLLLRPASEMVRSSSGHYRAVTATDGPELLLPINWRRIAELLYEKPSARVAMAGDGIGHLDGQSGRSVYECGGYMRQPIEEVLIDLDWDGTWLRIAAEGTLQQVERKLGPRFTAALDVHANWLSAHARLPAAKPTGAAR